MLVQGPGQPSTVADLIRALVKREVDPYSEARSQIAKILATGIRLSHLDTHKHTHLLPPVLDAVSRLAREFQIPWVRRPFDFGIGRGVRFQKQLVALGMRFARPAFAKKLAGLRTTDHFTGFQITGTLNTANLTQTLEKLPPGLTEFMCHPGYLGPELAAAKTRLKQSRADELAALTSPEARAVLQRRDIQLVNYSSTSL
jgi:predicted glycoside hydrolase/deacetylase ChbG (UPF0249 family)